MMAGVRAGIVLGLGLVTAMPVAAASHHHATASHHTTSSKHGKSSSHAKSSKHAKPEPHHAAAAPGGAQAVPAGGVKLFCGPGKGPLLVRKMTQGAGTTVTLICR